MKNTALAIAMIGILCLLVLANAIEPKQTEISSINEKYLNKKIKVVGESKSIKVFENNFTYFKVEDETAEIEVICSCPEIPLKSRIEIIGRVEKYQGKLQIQADVIRKK